MRVVCYIFQCITATMLALCCVSSAVAIDRNVVDEQVSPYLENEIVHGLVVGVIDKGQQASFGCGHLNSDSDESPSGTTVFEIGSMSKVFTGILLADAVVRNQVTLQTPIQELLPDNVVLVERGAPIRLIHLSTHTSGLPRLPANLKPSDPSNPYADYGVGQLHEFLNGFQPSRAPNEKSEYSNLAVGLLGHLLARQAGTTYEQLLRERILDPLGMSDTAITLNESMQQRLAPPHLSDGSVSTNWDIPTLAGAGAIRSTVDDMLRFLAAQLDPPQGELGQAIDLAWQVHFDTDEPAQFDMGLGWHLARDGQTRWHNGQTGGYHAMMLANRKLGIATVVLANTATAEVDALAESLVQLTAGIPVKPRTFSEQAKEVPVDADVMQRYEGKYELFPGFVLTVSVKKGELFAEATGQPAFRIFAKSDTEWFYKVVDAQLVFEVDDNDHCTAVTLHQNGQVIKGKRLE